MPGEGGGPKREFSDEELAQLKGAAAVGATRREMAAMLGVDEDTIYRRCADTPAVARLIKQAESQLHLSLRRQQLRIALAGPTTDSEGRTVPAHPQQATMLIFLGKVMLGQSERVIHRIETPADAIQMLKDAFPDLTDAELQELSAAGDSKVH